MNLLKLLRTRLVKKLLQKGVSEHENARNVGTGSTAKSRCKQLGRTVLITKYTTLYSGNSDDRKHAIRRIAFIRATAFTDRMAMMGHSEARMSALYTADDLQRQRTVLDQMAARLVPATASLTPPQHSLP
jgi:hypothetical protein